ncbi:MAG TPA: hypothetical protein H9666_04035 [Firmicutes bacterium]|nr:hypothetical protein [Bacillota bacterium]
MRRYFDRASFWMVLGTVLLTGTAQALNSGFSYYIWLYQSGAFGNDFASGLSDATAQWNYTIWQWLLPSLCVAWALFVVYRKKDILYYTLPLVLIVLLGNGVEEGIVWIFQQYFHGQRTGLFYTSQSFFLPQGMTVWGWLLGALLCLWARRAKPKEAGRRWRDLAPFAAVCIGYWAICSALLIWLPRAERSSPAPLFAEWFLQLAAGAAGAPCTVALFFGLVQTSGSSLGRSGVPALRRSAIAPFPGGGSRAFADQFGKRHASPVDRPCHAGLDVPAACGRLVGRRASGSAASVLAGLAVGDGEDQRPGGQLDHLLAAPLGALCGSGSLLCCRVWIALEKNREPGEKAG